jgi:hypothetical protein
VERKKARMAKSAEKGPSKSDKASHG